MSDKSYAQLLKRIEELIATSPNVTDPTAGTPAAKIHDWISRAEYYLSLLEDKIPTALSEFRSIRQSAEFKLDEDVAIASKSAYRPEGADVLLDFNFARLAQANDILKFAATKLKLEEYSPPADLANEELRKELRAARLRAGHSQREAAAKIGYDHKDISEWERGKRKPHPKAAKNILDYIAKHPKQNQP